MSVHIANSELSFHLPSLSYVDAKWEEPNLRSAADAPHAVREGGPIAWLSRQIASFAAWRSERQAAAELAAMSDHELMDIGVSRSDVSRVFDRNANLDLRQRGFYA